MTASRKNRCTWPPLNDKLYVKYHDTEWGVPVRRDKKIFEFLVLESAQAGLSWRTILYKREGYRKAFAGFDPVKVAAFSKRKIDSLVKDPGIVRNRLKIESTVNNAQRFLEVKKEYGTFSKYMWSWVDGKPVQNNFRNTSDIPAVTETAIAFSKDLKKRGFKFLGPTVIYAHMQAVGMVNDHITACFRHTEVQE